MTFLSWMHREQMKAAACHGVITESHWLYLLFSPPVSCVLAPEQQFYLPIAAAQTEEGDGLAFTVLSSSHHRHHPKPTEFSSYKLHWSSGNMARASRPTAGDAHVTSTYSASLFSSSSSQNWKTVQTLLLIKALS